MCFHKHERDIIILLSYEYLICRYSFSAYTDEISIDVVRNIMHMDEVNFTFTELSVTEIKKER